MGPLGIVTCFGLAALTSCSGVPALAQIHVNLYNDAGANEEMLARALEEADRILLTAGVRLTWSHCLPAEPGGEPCVPPGPATLQLRLYPPAAEAKFPVPSDAFGFALSPPPSESGYFAGIFHARVEALARKDRIRIGQLLGHVIAHEIGHLLFGGGGHAADGIMKFPWRAKELGRLQSGTLLFLSHQSKIIRRNVEVRLLLKTASQHRTTTGVGCRLSPQARAQALK